MYKYILCLGWFACVFSSQRGLCTKFEEMNLADSRKCIVTNRSGDFITARFIFSCKDGRQEEYDIDLVHQDATSVVYPSGCITLVCVIAGRRRSVEQTFDKLPSEISLEV